MVTVKELSKLFYLKKDIEDYQNKLNAMRKERAELEERIRLERVTIDGLTSANMDGMPKGSSVSSRVESTVIHITEMEAQLMRTRQAVNDLEMLISAKQTIQYMEHGRLEAYIVGIDGLHLQQAFRARFAECKTWQEVAVSCGFGSAESAKKSVYRYLKEGRRGA